MNNLYFTRYNVEGFTILLSLLGLLSFASILEPLYTMSMEGMVVVAASAASYRFYKRGLVQYVLFFFVITLLTVFIFLHEAFLL